MKNILTNLSAITFSFFSAFGMEKDNNIDNTKAANAAAQKIEITKAQDHELSTGFISLIVSGYLKEFQWQENDRYQFDKMKRNPERVIEAIEFLERRIEEISAPLENAIKDDLNKYKEYLNTLFKKINANKIIYQNDTAFQKIMKILGKNKVPVIVFAEILSKLENREQAIAVGEVFDFIHLNNIGFHEKHALTHMLKNFFPFDPLEKLINIGTFFGEDNFRKNIIKCLEHPYIREKDNNEKLQFIGQYKSFDTKNQNLLKLIGCQWPSSFTWHRGWWSQEDNQDLVMEIFIEPTETFNFNENFFKKHLEKYGVIYEIKADRNNVPNKLLELRIKDLFKK